MNGGLQRVWRGMSLARRFALTSLVIIVACMLAVGWWVAREIEGDVVHSTAVTTALFTNSFLEPRLQSLATDGDLTPEAISDVENLLNETPLGERIVSIKIWGRGGRILYATNPALRGQVFTPTERLKQAWQGVVGSELSSLDDVENRAERTIGHVLLETYSPVKADSDGQIIAVAEFYVTADDLVERLARARLNGWLIVLLAGATIYGLLYGLVMRASRTITSQQSALRAHVGELSQAMAANEQLHSRVRQASAQASELNERLLRRISTELHDGPAQGIGFALLRLDALRAGLQDRPANGASPSHDIDRIRHSLSDALGEIRNLCSGIALPELSSLNLSQTVQRAVRAHERRTESKVELTRADLPDTVPDVFKICVYRLIQEALNNAFFHGGGIDQRVDVARSGDDIVVTVSDGGEGFEPAGDYFASNRLGIAGMRRRVEEFGGRFAIESRKGGSTRMLATLPLPDAMPPGGGHGARLLETGAPS